METALNPEALSFCFLQRREHANLVQGLCVCIYDADKIENNNGSQGN